MKLLATLLILLCACNSAKSGEFSAKVIAVLDGDTVQVLRDGHPVKVRIAGIDAPEKDQEYGMTSRRFLSDLVLHKQVQVSTRAVDDYGRLVAQIDVGTLNVEQEMVQRGLAWEYSRFHSDKKLIGLQNEAKSAQRGLWAQPYPVPPEKWRKTHVAMPVQNVTQAAGCGQKKRCSQMSSCDEAYFYLLHCGVMTLDSDGDRVPCERLCAAKIK